MFRFQLHQLKVMQMINVMINGKNFFGLISKRLYKNI